jgi:hypothetical protein
MVSFFCGFHDITMTIPATTVFTLWDFVAIFYLYVLWCFCFLILMKVLTTFSDPKYGT